MCWTNFQKWELPEKYLDLFLGMWCVTLPQWRLRSVFWHSLREEKKNSRGFQKEYRLHFLFQGCVLEKKSKGAVVYRLKREGVPDTIRGL